MISNPRVYMYHTSVTNGQTDDKYGNDRQQLRFWYRHLHSELDKTCASSPILAYSLCYVKT